MFRHQVIHGHAVCISAALLCRRNPADTGKEEQQAEFASDTADTAAWAAGIAAVAGTAAGIAAGRAVDTWEAGKPAAGKLAACTAAAEPAEQAWADQRAVADAAVGRDPWRHQRRYQRLHQAGFR